MIICRYMYRYNRGKKVELHVEGDVLTLLFKKVKGKQPLTEKEANEVSVFLKAYYKEIMEKWNKVFINHQVPEFEVIRKKLKKKKI